MNSLIVWSPGVTIEEIERQVILRAYEYFKQVKTTTANALGISIRTLDHKLERYGLDDKQQKELDEQRRKDRELQLARSRGLAPAGAVTTRKIEVGATEQAVQTLGHSPDARHDVESAKNIAEESAVPVSKREEVQALPPRQVAASGGRSRR